MFLRVVLLAILCLTWSFSSRTTTAFVVPTHNRAIHHPHQVVRDGAPVLVKSTPTFARKPLKDYDFIESRDMTREEMIEYNKRSEEKMQQEFGAMTIISLLLSVPMLYLCWVAFFSE